MSNETVHVDLVGGENQLDARALDVRLVVQGGEGADVIRGGDGDDLFHVGSGDDVIDGDGGEDTARFSGARDDYELGNGDGVVSVRDTRDGSESDGDNTLSNIEFLQFSDGLYSSEGELIDAPGSAPAMLAGVIETRAGDPLDAAEVIFTPSDGDGSASGPTDAAGGFAFELASGMEGRLDAVRDYGGGDPDITAQDALEVLRLAVGLEPSWGPAEAHDYIAADVNGDGEVTAQDALDVLRHAVGLDTEHAPEWVFVDADDTDQLADIRRDSVSYETGIDPAGLDAETADMTLTGILRGNMEEYA
ncbi:dockerin type I domain-containing protein [Aquicoccus sp.]|uniref:dockerin type I domain-containing protein n=1 Tax=Aquicoccus sp. TaxID=2055851 RepID=UPI003567D9E1